MIHEPDINFSSSSADLVYGVNAAGKIVHISDVRSGLECRCQCPACGKPLVAKKGPMLAGIETGRCESPAAGLVYPNFSIRIGSQRFLI